MAPPRRLFAVYCDHVIFATRYTPVSFLTIFNAPAAPFVFAVYRAAVVDSHPEWCARGRHGSGSLRAQPWGDIAGPGGDVRLSREDYGARHEVGSALNALSFPGLWVG